MSAESRTLVVFGAGELGGPVIAWLAGRYPHPRYVLACRSSETAEKRANLARYMCSQWGVYPALEWETVDLMNVDQTAELLERHSPDVVFNAATPFAYWQIDDLPEPLRMLSHAAGHGVWGA